VHFVRMQGVLKQRGNRHGANATRHRRDPLSARERSSELNVAADFAIWQAVDTHINHNCALANPIAFNHLRLTYRYHENFGRPYVAGQIARSAMGDGDSATGQQ
jgi:hypothetical protein